MRVVLDINKDAIIEFLKYSIVKSIQFFYRWLTTDGEVLGYILSIFHMTISFAVFAMIIVSHTLVPSFKFQLFTFLILLAIWLHHIFLNVCIYIVAEKDLTKTISPYSELLKTLLINYNISPNNFVTYFILIETVGVGCFALEITSRCFHLFFKFMKD